MLAHAPRVLPPLAVVLADIGNPSTADLAAVLDVDVRTIQRWIADDKMPRAAHLALFWLTRWGRSIVDTRAVNDARLYASLARSRDDELRQLRGQLARLLAIADFGSANDPLAA
jgi:hypothetical protein